MSQHSHRKLWSGLLYPSKVFISCLSKIVQLTPKSTEIVGEFINYANSLFPNAGYSNRMGQHLILLKRPKTFFGEILVQISQWPANAPDNNPVENAWTMLKSFLETKNPTNKQELIQHVQEWQHKILPKTTEKLMSPMRLREKRREICRKMGKSRRVGLKINKSMHFFNH